MALSRNLGIIHDKQGVNWLGNKGVCVLALHRAYQCLSKTQTSLSSILCGKLLASRIQSFQMKYGTIELCKKSGILTCIIRSIKDSGVSTGQAKTHFKIKCNLSFLEVGVAGYKIWLNCKRWYFCPGAYILPLFYFFMKVKLINIPNTHVQTTPNELQLEIQYRITSCHTCQWFLQFPKWSCHFKIFDLSPGKTVKLLFANRYLRLILHPVVIFAHSCNCCDQNIQIKSTQTPQISWKMKTKLCNCLSCCCQAVLLADILNLARPAGWSTGRGTCSKDQSAHGKPSPSNALANHISVFCEQRSFPPSGPKLVCLFSRNFGRTSWRAGALEFCLFKSILILALRNRDPWNVAC